MTDDLKDLLPRLREDPQDLRGDEWGAERADEAVYRLGLRAQSVPGLPSALEVGQVSIEFVEGPMRVQATQMRQRHGIPVVFDKAMERLEIGAGELMAVLVVRESPVPEDFESAFMRWQGQALAAAGMVAAVLDERVTGRQLFEDVVLLRSGSFVGAVDMQGRVRTYLPFEVGKADMSALGQLADLTMSESSRAARAARLYRRAALEGPTADGYAMLWVAAESFSSERSPSRKQLETALRDAGLNPDGLPVHVGRLIGLRGEIQHQGLEDHKLLKPAFYEMEAIVRALIRREANIRGGWWPASDNPAGFADPFKPMVASHHDRGSTVWHTSLPEVQEPEAQRIPRQIPRPDLDPRLDLDPAFGDHTQLIAALVVDALEWQAPDVSLKVTLGRPDTTPPGVTRGSRADGIWLDPVLLEGLDDPTEPKYLVYLAWELPALVGTAVAQHAGLVSDGDGVTAIEAIGAYLQYLQLITFGELDSDFVPATTPDTPLNLGKIAGWAAAGHEPSQETAADLPGRDGEIVRGLVESLAESEIGPAVALSLLTEYAMQAKNG